MLFFTKWPALYPCIIPVLMAFKKELFCTFRKIQYVIKASNIVILSRFIYIYIQSSKYKCTIAIQIYTNIYKSIRFLFYKIYRICFCYLHSILFNEACIRVSYANLDLWLVTWTFCTFRILNRMGMLRKSMKFIQN